MKKIALAIGIVAMMVLGASCNKQKTCVCSYTATVLGITSTVELGEKSH